VGISRDCPHVLSTPIISRTGKATNFKFFTHIHRIDRNRSPLKISGKVAVTWTLEIFQGTTYRAHRAVIFAIAQPSCYFCFERILTILLLNSWNVNAANSVVILLVHVHLCITILLCIVHIQVLPACFKKTKKVRTSLKPGIRSRFELKKVRGVGRKSLKLVG